MLAVYEELLYAHGAKHGCQVGHYQLTLPDLEEMFWGDKPGQLLWWRNRLRAHHKGEIDALNRK